MLECRVKVPGEDWRRVAVHLDTDMDAALYIQKALVEGNPEALGALWEYLGTQPLAVLEYRPFAGCFAVTRYLVKSETAKAT